jgi:methionine-rich copper-binding protein CopC
MQESNMLSRIGSTLALVLVLAAATPFIEKDVHFALSRSVPAADASVSSPAELQLWFTQVPKPGSLSVRLSNARGDLVETPAPAAAENDAKEIHVALERRLAAGGYRVAWRGIGDDGHVVQGEFGFTVTTE